MALTENGMGTTMLVSPTGGYGGGNGLFGGGGDSWLGILFLIALCNGGFGFGGFGGGRGGSYARRGSYARGGRGYSRDDAREDFIDEIEELIEKAPDEHTRKKFERFLSEMK